MTELKSILERSFFERPALVVARDLLGKQLARRFEDREVRLVIIKWINVTIP